MLLLLMEVMMVLMSTHGSISVALTTLFRFKCSITGEPPQDRYVIFNFRRSETFASMVSFGLRHRRLSRRHLCIRLTASLNITKQHDQAENIPVKAVQAHYGGKETAP